MIFFSINYLKFVRKGIKIFSINSFLAIRPLKTCESLMVF